MLTMMTTVTMLSLSSNKISVHAIKLVAAARLCLLLSKFLAHCPSFTNFSSSVYLTQLPFLYTVYFINSH